MGVILHENLSWVKHVEKIHKKVAAGIGLLRRIRDFTSFDILIKTYKSLIQPHFEYASAVWDDLDVTKSQEPTVTKDHLATVALSFETVYRRRQELVSQNFLM